MVMTDVSGMQLMALREKNWEVIFQEDTKFKQCGDLFGLGICSANLLFK